MNCLQVKKYATQQSGENYFSSFGILNEQCTILYLFHYSFVVYLELQGQFKMPT